MALLWSPAQAPVSPAIVVPQVVPAEVSELVDMTWDSFVEAFPARRGCIGAVAVVLVRSVGGGDALYRPPLRAILIEIPTTPERFTESLAHELGHHIEATCAVEESIGAEFRRLQGIAPEVPWKDSGHWFDMPSEHFAETVVTLVLGERTTHSDIVEIREGAAQFVADWGAGDEGPSRRSG